MFMRTLVSAMLAWGCAAHAATLPTDGQWAAFDVAYDLSGTLGWIDIATGAPLTFTFTVPNGSLGLLTVVDGGFAGDVFQVTSGAVTLGATSVATNSYPSNVYLDFDAALADARYSRRTFTLPGGSYTIGGLLLTSALDGNGMALDTTVGGIRLALAPVPEAGTAATLLAGLGLLACVRRARWS